VVIKEKDQAIRDTATIAGADTVDLYADASAAKRLAAIAVVQRPGIVTQVVRRDSIGWTSTSGALSAEIAAIAAALKYAQEHLKQVQQLVVFSDSQQALRATQAGNDARTGRALLSKIAENIETLCRAGVDLRFRWSPGHEGIVGNEEADDAAREASSHTGKPTAPALERVREVAGVKRLINRDRSEDSNPVRHYEAARPIYVEIGSGPTWKAHPTVVRVAYVGPGLDPHPGENGSLPAEPVPVPSRTGGRC
jgi:ribonuclease HI